MLHQKLIKLRLSKSRNGGIFRFAKRCISCSRFSQSQQEDSEFVDNALLSYVTRKNNKMKVPTVFYEYIQNVNPKFRDRILKNYLTLSISDTDPYLISREVGNTFVKLIKDDLTENMSHVIELNPGFGILTKSLLDAGIPFLNMYEKYNVFYPELSDLKNRYPNRMKIKNANLFKISKMMNLGVDVAAGKDICNLLDSIPKRKWEDKSCMQVIGTTNKSIFIRHLVISVIFQTGFMMYGRPIFYLALPPSIWNKYTSPGKKISANYILFNILFNYKMLGTLDRKGFIPWLRNKKLKNTEKIFELDQNNKVLFLVKLEPRADLFTLFADKKNMIYFWHFVRHHFYKPTMRVIPALEKMMPGCGVKLIGKNYTIFTEFGHLNPIQVLNLYMEFTSWPEFKESTFLLSANDIKKIYDPYLEEEND